MRKTILALLIGTIFGAGLALSDMVNPARVLAFLDVFGAWDPTLAFVMGGAMIPAAVSYLISRKMDEPLFHTDFHIPANRIVDRQLVAGGLVFGAGWGLVGFCPGPAIAGLVFGNWQTYVFVLSMLAGMWLFRYMLDPHHPRREKLVRF
jgi:uncharacterized membrane protein YedE/YeeE